MTIDRHEPTGHGPGIDPGPDDASSHAVISGASRPHEVVIVYNPAAGHFSQDRLDELFAAFRDAGYVVRCCDSRSSLCETIKDTVDHICIFGGDGTVRKVVGESLGASATMSFSVFPSGTINLVAREMDYTANARDFVRRLQIGDAPQRHFVGRVDAAVFQCCASVGPDAFAVACVSDDLKSRFGRLAYLIAIMQRVWTWPRHALDLAVDGVPYCAENVFILKGRYYAGPWILDRCASLTNSRLRLLLMPRARRRDMIRLALFALGIRIFEDARWKRLDASIVEVRSKEGLPIQADGDIVGETPARISVDPTPVCFL